MKKFRIFLSFLILFVTTAFAFQNCAPVGFEAVQSNVETMSEDFSSLKVSDELESSYVPPEVLRLSQNFEVSHNKTADLSILRNIAAGLHNNQKYGIIDLGTANYDGLTLKQCAYDALSGNDNKAFLERALADVGGKYVTFLFPKGIYCFSRISLQNVTGITFQGMGSEDGGTVLRLLRNQTALFKVTSPDPEANAANYLSFADFKITMAEPNKASVVAFDVTGTVNGLSVRRIVAHNIGRFAKLYGKMLNLAFETITIKGARAPVFFFDGPYRPGGKDKWGPQPISFFSVTGSSMVGPGAWIRFAGAASINLHNLDLTGGTNAVQSMKGPDTNPRYITGQGLRLHSQTGPALKFENGLGIQLDDVTIDGCREYGVYVGGVFDRGAQFSDFKINGCSKYGFRLNNVDFVSIINPKIELKNNGKAAVRLEQQVRESVLHGGQLSGSKVPVERACKQQKCPSFIAKGMGFFPASWKPGTFAYTDTLISIQERRKMLIASPQWNAINNGNDASLQNAINELCSTGGTILIGQSGVELSSRVNLPAHCKPIEIRGTSREDKSRITIATKNAGLDVSGKGHNLRELNFFGTESVKSDRPLVITDAEDILMDSNTFKHFAEGVRVQRSKNLYFNYNRYANIRGFAGLLLNSPEKDGVNQVKMLLETSKCVYSADVDDEGVAAGAITDPGCASATAFAIRGGVTNLVSIQSAYITGGTSIDIASSGNVNPGVLRFFQMGSDNPLTYSLKASNVRVLQVDGAWLGQAKTAVRLLGGTSTDKITFRLSCIQGTENTLHSTDSNANIASLGGWIRVSEPRISTNTRLISTLFEPRSWAKIDSKIALSAARNNLNQNEDTGENDTYVPSDNERLQAAESSYQTIFGVAPSTTERARLQSLIESGFSSEEIAEALQDARAIVNSQFVATWNSSPKNADLALLTMDWLFNDNGANLEDRIASYAPQRTPAVSTTPTTPSPTPTASVPNACAFAGNTVAHGATVTAYANSRVPFGSTCQSERRLCNNGTLSGSLSHSICNVDTPAACDFVSGIKVAHGDAVMAYANSRVPFGGTCQAERRLCNNGTLSGSLSHSICNVDTPAACDFVSGIKVDHGHSVVAYKTTKAVNGKCASERRLCDNGNLRGSYGHSFCR